MIDMQMDLEIVNIASVAYGDVTEVKDHTLFINKEELLDYVADPYFASISLDLAMPGDSIRIIPVKDVVEPRIKVDGGGSFPGFFGSVDNCGEGRTRTLRGCAIMTTGTIVGFQEGIVDMSGIGAEYCPYAKLNNVVLTAEPIDKSQPAEHEKALRILGLKAAHYLAKAGLDADVDEVEHYELGNVSDDLPRVGMIYMTMCQGLIHDNYLFGVDVKRLHPTYIHPNEIFDGAMVNGTCVIASHKNTTWDHQNNRIIKELYSRHGKELNFLGCIISPVYPVLKDKYRCAHSSVNIARLLKLDGVVIPEEGGGNPESDLMMLIKGCETHGIKTVGIVLTHMGVEGLTTFTDEADAMITTGYLDDYVTLLPMEKTLGHPEQVRLLSGGGPDSLREDGSMYVSVVAIMGAHNELGSGKLASKVI